MVILYSHFQLITDCIEIISVYSSLEEAKQNQSLSILSRISYMAPSLLYMYYIYIYRVWLPLFPTETLVNL